VHVIHEWAWAGTPNEGAAWLRLQRLADTWHRVLLIPVTGGVIVGMMHGLLEILEQIKPSGSSKSSQRQGFNVLGGVFPTIKAIQAAVTLGTGCSLGPEGPSVDIGKSCAHGCYIMMENNRERKIALVAAGAAAGIASDGGFRRCGQWLERGGWQGGHRWLGDGDGGDVAMVMMEIMMEHDKVSSIVGWEPKNSDERCQRAFDYLKKVVTEKPVLALSNYSKPFELHTDAVDFAIGGVLKQEGFNAAVAGCFFAIETVLRPLRAENSPPFTTAMIILASVISSTVSNELLGNKSAFTVPSYDLKSAAELPLYLILGMLCGVVSVVFTRLVAWYTKFFEFIKEKFGLPSVVCPALGGLGVGIIALKYPGILYWGFTNVDEILHTGKSASAPGIWLLAQLAAAKVVATALCKGSGLVGGLYAPSLMIGAAVGAVFGGSAAELINSALPGNTAVAQPQAYALVGMAATLASVCSVPLTSVLLLFELTKDYRILLPLMGAVGLAIWVPSVANQRNETDSRNPTRGYSFVFPRDDAEDPDKGTGDHLELSVMKDSHFLRSIDEEVSLDGLKVSHAMSKNYLKVGLDTTLRDVMKYMRENQQNCALVVDDKNLLEGILTSGDMERCLSKNSGNSKSAQHDVYACPVYSVCTRGMSYRGVERGVLTCYPDTDLVTAKDLMEAKGIGQLPVVMRGGDSREERRRRIVAVLHYDSISNYLSEELAHQRPHQRGEAGHHGEMVANGH
uniref:Chloride channel protein n=1 Tax=Chenopodium quinoa TaxID=63459 RepID=A0A803N9A9_CHEQI